MQQSPASRRRVIAAVACLVVVMLAGSVAPARAQSTLPGAIPPKARPYGSSYAEWNARWWQWALALPAEQNPFFDVDGSCANGANGQGGQVWFLTGVFNESGVAQRNCTVPAGKALFFPLINVECSTLEVDTPFYGGNEAELRACLQPFDLGSAFVEVDGVRVENLSGYQSESPLFSFTAPADNVLGVVPGTGESVAKGYYVMLHPLAVGNHTIRYGGALTSPYGGFALDITYNLTVGN